MKKMDDNVKILPKLMDFFAVEENLARILECTRADEIMKLLHEKE